MDITKVWIKLRSIRIRLRSVSRVRVSLRSVSRVRVSLRSVSRVMIRLRSVSRVRVSWRSVSRVRISLRSIRISIWLLIIRRIWSRIRVLIRLRRIILMIRIRWISSTSNYIKILILIVIATGVYNIDRVMVKGLVY